MEPTSSDPQQADMAATDMSAIDSSADMSLLRRFEPVLRFTQGERFFPMDVEPYVEHSGLWVQRPNRAARCVVPQGELTLEQLAQPHEGDAASVYFLKLINPEDFEKRDESRQYRRFKNRQPDSFRVGDGRLARVGYLSRFVDAVFSLSLLARGRVPGETAATAKAIYREILEEHEGYRYYGRVVRQNDWIVLQYWFFYLFNNWRSGFFGANDHEADWEMINIYLYQSDDGTLTPEWVAYASHDFHGDDLRRRWDDPEVEKVGEHPIIYAGAGSHASYYNAGEYLTELQLSFLAPYMRIADTVKKFWQQRMRQYRSDDEAEVEGEEHDSNIFVIPFVDYGRGDGLSIGPEQEHGWEEPGLLDTELTWVSGYRGLWGLYAKDPFAGENAPAGPMYNRDGSVRRAWYDPVGWSGLDKVLPPNRTLDVVLQQQEDIHKRQLKEEAEVEEKRRQLEKLGIESDATATLPHLVKLHESLQEQIITLSDELNTMRAKISADQALLEALEKHEAKLRTGDRGPLRAHIQRAHQPASITSRQVNRLVDYWSAISIGLVPLGYVGLASFAPDRMISGLIIIISVFMFIEAAVRQRLTQFLTSVNILLSLVAVSVILYEFWWESISILILAAGAYTLWDNLRELWT